MDRRIAVNFTCGRLHNSALQPLCKAQHIDGAVDRCLSRLHRIVLIVHGRRWASEIVNLISFDVEGKRNVVAHELKTGMSMQMLDIPFCTCEEIVDTKNFMALRDEHSSTQIEQVGKELRAMMPFLHTRKPA